jgi:hypothetical protein
MKNKILLLTILLFLGSCRLFSGASRYNLAMMDYAIPDGTPIFQEGYRDGCESGLYSRGNSLYKIKYSGHKYNPKLIDNPEYKFAFGRGYGYCFTLNTAGGHSGGADKFIYGKGVPFDMGRTSYDGTINYEQGSWRNPFSSGSGVNGIFEAVQSPKGFSVFGSHPLYGTNNDKQIFGW